MVIEDRILQRGDAVPHFDVRTVAGNRVSYTTIWQHRNLVLVSLPPEGADSPYVAELDARAAEFQAHESVCVITSDRVAGLPPPGVLIADRWGEIVHLDAPQDVSEFPPASALLEWLDFLERRCPECEGEAK